MGELPREVDRRRHDALPPSLPPAPAGAGGGAGGGGAGRGVPAAGLVVAEPGLRLLAAVASVIVAMVLLVERNRSGHAAGPSRYQPRVSETLFFPCVTS